MTSFRLCVRFTFLSLLAVVAISVISFINQGVMGPALGWQFSYLVPDTNVTTDNSTALQEPKICNHKNMSKVLLVISFVDGSYKEIPVLEELYRKHFPNIVYCGPIEAQTGSDYEILVAEVQHGITAYSCIAGAARAYPSYEGYLFIRDNLFVNYWRLAELDLRRIWQTPKLGSQAMFQQSRDPWIWWYTPWGLKACEKVFRRLVSLNAAEKEMLLNKEDTTHAPLWDVQNTLNALLWNGRGKYKCYQGNANIFYIPARYLTAFQQLAEIFEDFNVYMNIAVSTIIQMVELEDKVIELNGVDIGELYGEERATREGKLFWTHLNSTATYVRPLGIKANYSSPSGALDYKEAVKALLDRLYDNEKCVEGSTQGGRLESTRFQYFNLKNQ